MAPTHAGVAELVASVSLVAMAVVLSLSGAAGAADGVTGRAPQAPRPRDTARPQTVRVYVGTYTGSKSKGIYQMHLDLASGPLGTPELAGEATNPSFLAIHPNRRFLYAVSEVWGPPEKSGGSVSAFAIAPDTGRLTRLNTQSSGGVGPCYVSVDRQGTSVLAANYGSGIICRMPIGQDGRLAKATSVIQHKGSGPDPKRQEGPHAHCIIPDPSGRFALATDLGLDRILLYRLDSGTLVPGDPPAAPVAAGAGPRHMAFHPNGRFLYVINELAGTVTAFGYDAQRGALAEVQTLSTLPADFRGRKSCAEIQVHPSGRFLYGSNRGHDSIAIFAVDGDAGTLKPLGHQSTQGKEPRHFGIDPTGAYLLAANQNSDTVVVFRIDPQTGQLSPTGAVANVPAPVCVKFLPMP